MRTGDTPPTGDPVSPSVLVLDDRYELQQRLGAGGMGTVYRAHDRVLNEAVAVKLLRHHRVEDARVRERFKSEIRLARRVRHPNVCSIFEFGEAAEGPYISMELVEGSDLRQLLKRGRLPVRVAFELSIQVAEGLQAVHDAGVVHRDLKTANIMLDARGTVRLMDFGIAKLEGERGSIATGQRIIGTPDYMSPEQAQGQDAGPRSDIYSLGVVVFEIFTGRRLFQAPTPLGVVIQHVHDEPPLFDPALPPSLRPLLERCLAKLADARPPTARVVASELRDAWNALAAPTPEQLAGAGRGRHPRPAAWWPWALGVVLVIGGAATGLSTFLGGAPPETTTGVSTTVPAATTSATLLVVVHPWGELSVDDKPAGTTPLDWIPVTAGAHVVRVRHPSLGTWQESVQLTAGERRRIVVDLTKQGKR